jgi:hypothetical protein
MPRFTVTSAKAVAIPASKSRRMLDWKNVGNEVHMSFKATLDTSDDTLCGIPVADGEGRSHTEHQGDCGRARYFRATGSDSVIYYTEEK